MQNIGKILSGENLVLYQNIQETIRLTQRKVRTYNAKSSNEDISPILMTAESIGGTSLSSTSGDSKYSIANGEDETRSKALGKDHQCTPINYGFRDVTLERSDYMWDELKHKPDPKENRLSKITRRSSQEKFLMAQELPAFREDAEPKPGLASNGEFDMQLYEKLTPEEQKNMYHRICDRYGQESGRRYLLVRSMTTSDEKIEAWTTTECPPYKAKKYSNEKVLCPKYKAKQSKYLCPEIGSEVKKKMATLVEITPLCTTENRITRREWKSNLKTKPPKMSFHVSVKGESDLSFFSEQTNSENTPCQCGTYACDCHLVKEKCDIPKIRKHCYLMDENAGTNNFLISCREKLQDKKLEDRRATVLQLHAVKAATRVTRESVYLQSSYDQVKSELETCLVKVMPPQGQEVIETGKSHVQELANIFAEHKMINEHEWRAWRHAHAKMENADNSDEVDSIDSDIVISESSEDQISECNLKVPNVVHPSRIPYFKETYELADVFFDKLNAKTEKLISKNRNRNAQLERPISSALFERIKLLSSSCKIFNQITKRYKSNFEYPKKLTPFSERKRRKLVKAENKNADLLRTLRFRKYIESIQLGKRYRRPKRSFLYTKLEDYRGFSPRRQKLLQENGDGKFTKCNLVGNELSGRVLSQKSMHKDYRLIRRMFDDQMNRNKESLWAPGMMARMKEYLGMIKDVKKDEEAFEEEEDISQASFAESQRRPKKDEQKTQTARPYSWSYCSKSSGNAAEALTSMIRSLKCEAGSHAAYASTKTLSVSVGDVHPQTARNTSASSQGAGNEQSVRKSLDISMKNCRKAGRIPYAKQNSQPKRPHTMESSNTLAKSIHSIRSDLPKRDNSRRITLAKPSSALPPNLSFRLNVKTPTIKLPM